MCDVGFSGTEENNVGIITGTIESSFIKNSALLTIESK